MYEPDSCFELTKAKKEITLKNMKTIFRIMPLAVAAAIAAGCGNTGSKTAEQTAVAEEIIPTVSVEEVSVREVPQEETYTSTIQAYVKNNIAPQTAGRISRILVDVGDNVKKGQVVAEMDQTQLAQAELQIEPVAAIPFVPKYKEELSLGGERTLRYAKVSVTTDEGFVEIPTVGDVLQLYTTGNEMIADNFYYGKPWRLPAKLLYGRELYLVVSELKGDFYKEY